jgi:hypothetical protein
MKVDFKITFDEAELEEICLERCKSIETVIPGHFEADTEYHYGRARVTCTFVADELEPPVPKSAPIPRQFRARPCSPATHSRGRSSARPIWSSEEARRCSITA